MTREIKRLNGTVTLMERFALRPQPVSIPAKTIKKKFILQNHKLSGKKQANEK